LLLIIYTAYVNNYGLAVDEKDPYSNVGQVSIPESGIDAIISPDKPELVTHTQEDIIFSYETNVLMNTNLGMNIATDPSHIKFDDSVPKDAIEYITSDIGNFATITDNTNVEIEKIDSLTSLSLFIRKIITDEGGISEETVTTITSKVKDLYSKGNKIFDLSLDKAKQLINDIVKTIVPTDAYTTSHIVSIGQGTEKLIINDLSFSNITDDIVGYFSVDAASTLSISLKTGVKAVMLGMSAANPLGNYETGILIPDLFRTVNTGVKT
jgi:hypothetical protein